jgi:hypothetical protein
MWLLQIVCARLRGWSAELGDFGRCGIHSDDPFPIKKHRLAALNIYNKYTYIYDYIYNYIYDGQGYPKTYKSFEVGVLTDWGQLIIVSPISLYLDINSRYEERLLSLRGSAVQGCPG